MCIDEDLIYLLYYDMEFSLQKIADMIGVTQCTIINRMKKRGWKRRSKSETKIGDKNPRFGKHYSEEEKKKMSIERKQKGIGASENSGSWKGDNCKESGFETYVRRHKYKPEVCEECHQSRKLDLSFNHLLGKHTRDFNDYKYLCRSCHQKRDYKMGVRYCFNKIVGNRKF